MTDKHIFGLTASHYYDGKLHHYNLTDDRTTSNEVYRRLWSHFWVNTSDIWYGIHYEKKETRLTVYFWIFNLVLELHKES